MLLIFVGSDSILFRLSILSRRRFLGESHGDTLYLNECRLILVISLTNIEDFSEVRRVLQGKLVDVGTASR